ncbi:LapA family protein [Terasakiella sp. A23]|uniref:LapA family protein n=1 Tax=Terasakiella sp. FCG-A23 TaxID=3080561 RepID=UPI002953166B|nr:LapA family protein [Terasakiella sp. A23]MDV7339941.1 LapA family protein [Terasakiella sp. A23]
MRFLSWLLFLPFALVVVIFAVSNRGPIAVDFWPLPFSQDVPLYLLSLGTLAFGFFFGALLTWMSVAKWRVVAISRKKDTEYAEAEIERLNAKIKDLEKKEEPVQEVLPAVKTDAA